MDRRATGRTGSRAVSVVLIAVGALLLVGCGGGDDRSSSPPRTDGGTTLDVARLPTARSIEEVAAILRTGGLRCDAVQETEVVEKGRDGPLPVEQGTCTTDGGSYTIEVFATSSDIQAPAPADCPDDSARAKDGTWIGTGNRGASFTVALAPDAERKQEQAAGGSAGVASLWAIETETAEKVAASTDLAVIWTLVDCNR